MALNLYCDLNQLKRRLTGLADAVALDSQDASGFEDVAEAASRRVDGFTNRHFYAQTATKVFHGNGKRQIRLPDLLAATTVKLDEGEDGTFEITLTENTDFWLEREGYQDVDATPKTVIVLNRNGQKSYFAQYRRLLQIAGRWGFTEATENVLTSGGAQVKLAGGFAAGATNASVTAGSDVAVGQTLLLENEQVYVTAFNSGTNVATCTRGVNGTTDATHAVDTVVKRFVYIPDIVEATLEIASSLWKGRETGYVSSTITNPVIGSIDVFPGMPAQAKQLLMPYRIVPV